MGLRYRSPACRRRRVIRMRHGPNTTRAGSGNSAARSFARRLSALPDPRRIVSVAVTSFGEAGVLIDQSGEPTTDMIAWFDRRTLDQCRRFADQIDPDRLFSICGAVVQQIMTAPKLMWHRENEPETWARSVQFLMTADYIAYRLCGERAQNLSLSSRTALLDLRQAGLERRAAGPGRSGAAHFCHQSSTEGLRLAA